MQEQTLGFCLLASFISHPLLGEFWVHCMPPACPYQILTGSFCYGCVVTSWGPIPYLAYLLATALVFVFPAVYSYESKVGGRVSFQELFALRFAMALVMALRLKTQRVQPGSPRLRQYVQAGSQHVAPIRLLLLQVVEDTNVPWKTWSVYPVRLFTPAKSAGYNKTWEGLPPI